MAGDVGGDDTQDDHDVAGHTYHCPFADNTSHTKRPCHTHDNAGAEDAAHCDAEGGAQV